MTQAIRNKHHAFVSAYLAEGFDPDAVYFDQEGGGLPLLWSAANSGQEFPLFLLLEAGANPDPKGSKNEDTPLAQAAALGLPPMIEALLEAGAEVDARDLDDRTPLMDAVRAGNFNNARTLIKAGADTEARDAYGKNIEEQLEEIDSKKLEAWRKLEL